MGPPDTMIIFNETTPTMLYSAFNNHYPIPTCGLDQKNVYIGCCFNSLNLQSTFGHQSFSRNYLSQYSLQDSIPSSANQIDYCRIQSNTSLFKGYQELYVKSTGDCLENIKCQDGYLYAYSQDQCTGAVELFDVKEITTINSTILGVAQAGLYTAANASMQIVWIAEIPQEDFVPDFSLPIETFTLVLFIAVTMFNVYMIYNLAQRYRTSRRRMDLWHLTVVSFWFLKSIYFLLYVSITFSDNIMFSILTVLLNFSNIGTFMTSTVTCSILLQIFNIHSRLYKIILLSVVGVIHFALCIVYYVTYIFLVIDPKIFLLLYTPGITLFEVWQTVSLCFDYIPPFYLLYKLIRQEIDVMERYKSTRYKQYKKELVGVILMQVMTGILFSICNFNNNLSHNDYEYYGIVIIAYMLYIMHTLLNVNLYHSLGKLTKEMIEPSETLQPTPMRMLKLAVPTKLMDASTIINS
ncbi:hypothetical protein HDV04_005937 [Boothiomyces sp. JEL0838]|nr:hypothetical protein HDV04_005937 [Boothiomyces sp. JEL0838]